MQHVSKASAFRTLEPWEVELVLGGDGSGEDVTVIGDPGGGD